MWLMWLPRDLQDLLIPVEQRPRKGFEIRESKILGWDLSRFSICNMPWRKGIQRNDASPLEFETKPGKQIFLKSSILTYSEYSAQISCSCLLLWFSPDPENVCLSIKRKTTASSKEAILAIAGVYIDGITKRHGSCSDLSWSRGGITAFMQCHAVPGRPVDCYKAIHDTIEDTEVEMRTPMVQSCRRSCSSPSHETVDICGCQCIQILNTKGTYMTWIDMIDVLLLLFSILFYPFYPFVSFLIISCQFWNHVLSNFSMVRFGIADLSSRRPLPIGLWVLHWCLPANVHLQRDHVGFCTGV